MMKRLFSLLIAAFALLQTTNLSSAACDERAAKVVSETMNQQLAVLVGFTMVQCVPSTDAGKCSILCVTTSLESDDNVNILLSAITGMAAVNMRKFGVAKFSKVLFADKNLLVRRRYLAISAANADRFQTLMAASNWKPVELISRVRREYTEQIIAERK